jgi:lipoprotein-anchoring transpeptidase ErfK/SrfK
MTYLLMAACLALVPQRAAPQTQPNLQDVLAIQVALDRAGFSTGVIDGHMGVNTNRAIDAFRRANGRDPEPFAQPIVTYQITEADAAGPFQPSIPTDLMEQSKLSALSYRSLDELLAERFHTTPPLLKTLNRGSAMAAGDTISVPNVEPFLIPTTAPTATVQPSAAGTPAPTGTSGKQPQSQKATDAAQALPPVVVTVSRSASALTVTGPDGRTLMFAPVTTGSEHDPLPLGEWKVSRVLVNPVFHYNPDLFWDANPSHTKATIPAGPNGPVGVVWINLSKEHYGLHGAPEPSQIGRTQSHGCVRLTNWDAVRLANMVGPDTPVRFVE